MLREDTLVRLLSRNPVSKVRIINWQNIKLFTTHFTLKKWWQRYKFIVLGHELTYFVKYETKGEKCYIARRCHHFFKVKCVVNNLL
jgi:hypothetical protein